MKPFIVVHSIGFVVESFFSTGLEITLLPWYHYVVLIEWNLYVKSVLSNKPRERGLGIHTKYGKYSVCRPLY